MAPQASVPGSATSAAAADAATRTATAAATILVRSIPNASSPLPAPHLLLRHLDRAIASAEYAQASLLLSLPSPSACHIHPPFAQSSRIKEKSDRRVVSEVAAALDGKSAARFDYVSIDGSATDLIASDTSAITSSRDASTPGAASRRYDLRLADEAYRAGNASLSEGNIQKSLKLLQLASSNCPPDRPSAVAKIKRLIKIASQQLQRKQTSNGQTISPES